MKDLARVRKESGKFDVIVVGGGVSGWVSAVASARNGAETLLIERYGFLGGTATTGLVGPWMRFTSPEEQLITGIFEEFRQRLNQLGGIKDTTFDFEKYKRVAMEMVLESGVQLLLHTYFVGCRTESNFIKEISVVNKAGVQQLESEIYIDASGDGDLAAAAGVPFTVGREKDGLTQAMTLMFTVGGVDFDRVDAYFREHPEDYIHWEEDVDYKATGVLCRAGFFKAVERAKKNGKLDEEIPYLFFISIPTDQIVVFNTTHIHRLNPLDPWDLTEAEIKLRQQVWQIMDLLKELPGFEESFLLQTATQVGVRESRHFQGEYIFTGEDVRQGRKFDDVIARGNYGIDIHSPDMSVGIEVEEQSAEISYDIPYRSLLPVKVDNLLLAGRCISADHYGESAIRIQPICMAIGQAAGTAAALCVKEKYLPRNLPIELLQRTLVEQGANLGKMKS